VTELFRQLGSRLRAALGEVALRIDHIGSTACPVLWPSQSSTSRSRSSLLSRLARSESRCRRAARLAARQPGAHEALLPRTARRATGARPRAARRDLSDRDYLRTHPEIASEYGELKRDLAPLLATDRHAYTDAKEPFVWHVIRKADAWAQRTDREPPPSDA